MPYRLAHTQLSLFVFFLITAQSYGSIFLTEASPLRWLSLAASWHETIRHRIEIMTLMMSPASMSGLSHISLQMFPVSACFGGIPDDFLEKSSEPLSKAFFNTDRSLCSTSSITWSIREICAKYTKRDIYTYVQGKGHWSSDSFKNTIISV